MTYEDIIIALVIIVPIWLAITINNFKTALEKMRRVYGSRQADERKKWAWRALLSPVWPLVYLYLGGQKVYSVLVEVLRGVRGLT